MTAREKANDQALLSPENFRDPYDALSDEEFNARVQGLTGTRSPEGPKEGDRDTP